MPYDILIYGAYLDTKHSLRGDALDTGKALASSRKKVIVFCAKHEVVIQVLPGRRSRGL